MRCKKNVCRRHYPWRLWLVCAVALLLVLPIGFSFYVNRELKPRLYDLAEYEARATVTKTMNRALAQALLQYPDLCAEVYSQQGETVQLNADAANRARALLLEQVEEAVKEMPRIERKIPFGSLTNNSLLGGVGPAWTLCIEPEGYVQGELCENAEVLGVNNTRYSAVLRLQTLVNMVLDSNLTTLTVTLEVPLASVVVRGGTPNVYAADYR